MQKSRRRKLIRQDLEAMLSKYERRIQRLAEEAYKIRKLIETFDKPTKVEEPAAPVVAPEEATNV